jgi:hypothetical protein
VAFCECGCGQELSAGAKTRYKRGHKKEANHKLAKEFTASLRGEPTVVEPNQLPKTSDFDGLATSWDALEQQHPDPFAELLGRLPDDPEPDQKERDKASGIISPNGTPIVTKQVAQDIQGKLAFLLSMPASMLQTVDPICFPVLLERTPQISAALTPIICQSPDMVKFFTKGSGFILWLNLAVTLWPVIQTILAHHVVKSVGHKEELDPKTGEMKKVKVNVPPDYSQYAA